MYGFLFMIMMLVMASGRRGAGQPRPGTGILDRLTPGKSDLIRCINNGQNKAGKICASPDNTDKRNKLYVSNDWCDAPMRYTPGICKGDVTEHCTRECGVGGINDPNCITDCTSNCALAQQYCEATNEVYKCCCETDVDPLDCSTTCTCGEACTMNNGGVGVCQTDGTTCAVNIVPPVCGCNCGEQCTMVNGNFGTCQTDGTTCAVNIQAPICGCKCGEACTMDSGGSGICQTDRKTCAVNVNIQAPDCRNTP